MNTSESLRKCGELRTYGETISAKTQQNAVFPQKCGF
jgi:hypothetical protein